MNASRYRSAFAGVLVFLALLAPRPCRAEAAEHPVWLLANGFHTSIVLRARDVPFAREIAGSGRWDEIAFGWGAAYSYRHRTMSPRAVLLAMLPNLAAIHVVPVRGPLARRFPHSDIVLLRLRDPEFARLVEGIDAAFARDRAGRRVFLNSGYFSESRFYLSRERFYFPCVCNMWAALKLRRAGVPLFLPRAILADSLIAQASALGLHYQKKSRPAEEY